MTLPTELDPFEAAVAAAKAEAGEGSPAEPAESSPQDESTEAEEALDQVADDEEEQPEGESVEEPEVLEDTPEESSEEESEEDADEELFEDLEVEEPPAGTQVTEDAVREFLGIDDSVDLEELKNGGLRQADYTKKTQELAAQRKENEKALAFWERFTKSPKEVVEALAVQAGFLEEGQVPQTDVDLPFVSEEQVEARVQEEVEKRLAEHPAVVEAQHAAADQWIDSEFARIEEAYSVTLGPKSRQKVLLAAHNRGTDDLEGVFAILLNQQNQKSTQKKSLQKGAPTRPTGKDTKEANVEPPVGPDAFEQAVEMAMAQAATR